MSSDKNTAGATERGQSDLLRRHTGKGEQEGTDAAHGGSKGGVTEDDDFLHPITGRRSSGRSILDSDTDGDDHD